MKTLFTVLTALGLGLSVPSFADHKGKCSCDAACAAKCEKGEGKDTCKCKSCDCKDSHVCGGGDHCKNEHHHAPAKGEEKKK